MNTLQEKLEEKMEEKFNRLGLTREECPGYQTEYFEMKDFIFQVVIPAVRKEAYEQGYKEARERFDDRKLLSKDK